MDENTNTLTDELLARAVKTPDPSMSAPAPSPTPRPSITIELGKPGSASRARYTSQVTKGMNFQFVQADVLQNNKVISTIKSTKSINIGNCVFRTPAPGDYELLITEQWTDFVNHDFRKYPKIEFTVE